MTKYKFSIQRRYLLDFSILRSFDHELFNTWTEWKEYYEVRSINDLNLAYSKFNELIKESGIKFEYRVVNNTK